MAKRFYDTNYFSDPFILSLKSNEKLLYFYFITICDHAGVFEINEILGNFHLNCKNYSEQVKNFIKTHPDKIKRLNINTCILMNFCKRQYPKGVNSAVMQIKGAMAILEKWNIEIINKETFTLRVKNTYKEL